jgi:hypothetical protein
VALRIADSLDHLLALGQCRRTRVAAEVLQFQLQVTMQGILPVHGGVQ